jgi:hypothetical protein
VTEADFRKALYYAVREDFNADIQERNGGSMFPYIDTDFDPLIRQAIAFFESTPEEKLPTMCAVEIEALALAANRRSL